MTSQIVIALVGVFCTAVSGYVSFLLGKKKYNVEVESQQIENLNNAIETYKKIMEESLASQKKIMEEKVQLLNAKIESVQKENEDLRKENKALRNKVSELQSQLISFFGKRFAQEFISEDSKD